MRRGHGGIQQLLQRARRHRRQGLREQPGEGQDQGEHGLGHGGQIKGLLQVSYGLVGIDSPRTDTLLGFYVFYVDCNNINRGIRYPGSVKQCLGFCTADFLSLSAFESAEQKTKHCLTLGFLIPLHIKEEECT